MYSSFLSGTRGLLGMFRMNFLTPLLAVILALSIAVGLQQCRLERLAKKSAEWKVAVEQYAVADARNQLAIKQCGDVAVRNFEEAKRQKEAMEEAAMIAANERGILNEKLAEMAIESARLHELVQGDCVAAADPAFISSLYNRP